MYTGAPEASLVPPEWHAWLHYTTDQPLVERNRRPWEKSHLPNPTGTPRATGRPVTIIARRARPRHGRLRSLDAVAEHGRRSIVEVLTGAVVLLLAAGFLGYAVAHSGRTSVSGYPLNARFEHIDGLGVGSMSVWPGSRWARSMA